MLSVFVVYSFYKGDIHFTPKIFQNTLQCRCSSKQSMRRMHAGYVKLNKRFIKVTFYQRAGTGKIKRREDYNGYLEGLLPGTLDLGVCQFCTFSQFDLIWCRSPIKMDSSMSAWDPPSFMGKKVKIRMLWCIFLQVMACATSRKETTRQNTLIRILSQISTPHFSLR